MTITNWMGLPSFLLALLLPFAALHAEPFDTSKLQGLGDTRYQAFESEALGHPLHIYVRVPESAANDSLKKYPTVYLLDGGVTYPLLSAYYHYLRLGKEVPEMILVGISYGSDRFAGGNYRASDFTAPAKEHDYWGDAPLFQEVLESELIPLIEAQYPSDPQQRILYGHSLGGQFALFSALTKPELFWGRIAVNPALQLNLDSFMQWQGGEEMPIDASRLFVGESEFDEPKLKQANMKWVEFWSQAERQRPFVLETEILAGESHMSGVPTAFRQGLLWLLAQSSAAPTNATRASEAPPVAIHDACARD